MSAHTPGPWRVSNHIDEEGFADIEAVNEALYIRANWGWRLRKADKAQLTEAMQANARLIAAAPDLLAALQDVMHMVNGEYHFDHPTAVLCRAAIARATGSPP